MGKRQENFEISTALRNAVRRKTRFPGPFFFAGIYSRLGTLKKQLNKTTEAAHHVIRANCVPNKGIKAFDNKWILLYWTIELYTQDERIQSTRYEREIYNR